jgi:branched-chain amino acid transport system substrate-binding protein
MRGGGVDAIMLCSYLPGGASATRQLRAAGIDLPILTSNAMDGTYWLDAVPDLSNFYVPVQGSVYGDEPRPEVAALVARYKEKFNQAPVSTYAFPIYAALQLWADAVKKAQTIDASKVVEVMNSFHEEPTVLGPRSFTPKLHIQDRAPILIVEISKRAGKVVGKWEISEPVPTDVLYRLTSK